MKFRAPFSFISQGFQSLIGRGNHVAKTLSSVKAPSGIGGIFKMALRNPWLSFTALAVVGGAAALGIYYAMNRNKITKVTEKSSNDTGTAEPPLTASETPEETYNTLYHGDNTYRVTSSPQYTEAQIDACKQRAEQAYTDKAIKLYNDENAKVLKELKVEMDEKMDIEPLSFIFQKSSKDQINEYFSEFQENLNFKKTGLITQKAKKEAAKEFTETLKEKVGEQKDEIETKAKEYKEKYWKKYIS